jgi:uncharacterized protein YcbX
VTAGASDKVGSVVALWRYPVKSMMGEELNAADVTDRGLLGDRAYALVDVETGKVVSAKNPRKWPGMFDFRASFAESPGRSRPIPPARLSFPDGLEMTTEQADLEEQLSGVLGRRVRLASSAPEGSLFEGYWPEHDWLENRDEVFEFPLPPGTFFDMGAVHLVTTATIDALRSLAPRSRFEVRRFRPNIVVELADQEGFVESSWVGRTLSLGDEVQLRITQDCPRCVMTTLSQGDLPKDPNILRTAVQNNKGNVGVYAAVVRGGRVRRGDRVAMA